MGEEDAEYCYELACAKGSGKLLSSDNDEDETELEERRPTSTEPVP